MLLSGDVVSLTCFSNPANKPCAWILIKQIRALLEHVPTLTSSHTTVSGEITIMKNSTYFLSCSYLKPNITRVIYYGLNVVIGMRA